MKTITKIIIVGCIVSVLSGCETASTPTPAPLPLHNKCITMATTLNNLQQQERHNLKDVSPVKINQLQAEYYQNNCQMVLGRDADMADVN